jgi:hypothetical protein
MNTKFIYGRIKNPLIAVLDSKSRTVGKSNFQREKQIERGIKNKSENDFGSFALFSHSRSAFV